MLVSVVCVKAGKARHGKLCCVTVGKCEARRCMAGGVTYGGSRLGVVCSVESRCAVAGRFRRCKAGCVKVVYGQVVFRHGRHGKEGSVT